MVALAAAVEVLAAASVAVEVSVAASAPAEGLQQAALAVDGASQAVVSSAGGHLLAEDLSAEGTSPQSAVQASVAVPHFSGRVSVAALGAEDLVGVYP